MFMRSMLHETFLGQRPLQEGSGGERGTRARAPGGDPSSPPLSICGPVIPCCCTVTVASLYCTAANLLTCSGAQCIVVNVVQPL